MSNISDNPGRWEITDSQLKPISRDGVVEAVRTLRRETLSIGSPEARYQWDLSNLKRVVKFRSTDMILTVETGLSLKEIRQLTREKNLWLPLDCPDGIDISLADYLARDRSISWLGQRYGTAKDWIMGMTVVDDSGAEVRFGAEVVKSVAGYQLAPLYLGAEHSLGPVVAVSFRLIPLAATFIRFKWEDVQLVQALDWWHRQTLPLEGFRMMRRQTHWQAWGFTYELQLEKLAATGIPEQCLETTPALPSESEGGLPGGHRIVRLHVLPSQTATLLENPALSDLDLICYPDLGVIDLFGDPHEPAGHDLDALFTEVSNHKGRIVGYDGRSMNIAVHSPDEVTVLRRIKSILDPDCLFGPAPWV